MKIGASVFWGNKQLELNMSVFPDMLSSSTWQLPSAEVLWVWICVTRNKCVNSYVLLSHVEGSIRASAVLTLTAGSESKPNLVTRPSSLVCLAWLIVQCRACFSYLFLHKMLWQAVVLSFIFVRFDNAKSVATVRWPAVGVLSVFSGLFPEPPRMAQ